MDGLYACPILVHAVATSGGVASQAASDMKHRRGQ